MTNLRVEVSDSIAVFQRWMERPEGATGGRRLTGACELGWYCSLYLWG